MAEVGPVAKGNGEAASTSAPRGRVIVEHVARACTAYDALKANYEPGAYGASDAVLQERPDFL